MGDDFQAGDIVVCVKEDRCPYHRDLPEDDPTMVGHYFRVQFVVRSVMTRCIGGLRVEGSTDAWCAGTFRKLPKADDRFSEQMRALKPHRVRESA